MGVLVVVVTCALAGAEVASRADHKTTYLAVAAYVPQGAVLSSGDLSVVALTSAGGIDPIPAEQEASVVGRRAGEALQPGSLLVAGDFTASAQSDAGDALVGSSLAADQAPAGLAAGSTVLVVVNDQAGGGPAATSGAATSSTSGGDVLVVGTVYAISQPSGAEAVTSADETVTLEVPQDDAAAVTAASAAGDLSVAEIFPTAS